MENDEKYSKGDIFVQDPHSVADSLLSVDWPENLTDIELAFCRHLASGKQPTRAYMAAQSDAGEVINKLSASRRAGLILRRPEVARYIDDLRAEMMKHCVAKGAEIMAYLSAGMMIPLAQIDDNSPLCTKKTISRTIKTHKDGSETCHEHIVYEKVNPLECGKMLIRMQGLDAPVKVDHSHSSGVMLMPFTTDIDEWSRSVAQQQKELMDDAINV